MVIREYDSPRSNKVKLSTYNNSCGSHSALHDSSNLCPSTFLSVQSNIRHERTHTHTVSAPFQSGCHDNRSYSSDIDDHVGQQVLKHVISLNYAVIVVCELVVVHCASCVHCELDCIR